MIYSPLCRMVYLRMMFGTRVKVLCEQGQNNPLQSMRAVYPRDCSLVIICMCFICIFNSETFHFFLYKTTIKDDVFLFFLFLTLYFVFVFYPTKKQNSMNVTMCSFCICASPVTMQSFCVSNNPANRWQGRVARVK